MGSVNKVILVGNLGRDAEVRYTPGGAPVASFSIATTENWTSKDGEKHEQTEWHRIVLWGKSAESLQPYLTKGKQIYVEGRLQTRNWEKDGQKHYTTEVKADRIVLLSGGGRGVDRPMDHRRRHPVLNSRSGGENDRGGRRAAPTCLPFHSDLQAGRHPRLRVLTPRRCRCLRARSCGGRLAGSREQHRPLSSRVPATRHSLGVTRTESGPARRRSSRPSGGDTGG